MQKKYKAIAILAFALNAFSIVCYILLFSKMGTVLANAKIYSYYFFLGIIASALCASFGYLLYLYEMFKVSSAPLYLKRLERIGVGLIILAPVIFVFAWVIILMQIYNLANA